LVTIVVTDGFIQHAVTVKYGFTNKKRLGSNRNSDYRTPLIYIYKHTKMHFGVIFTKRGSVISKPIAIKFRTLVDLSYVINFPNFGVDESHDWVLRAVTY